MYAPLEAPNAAADLVHNICLQQDHASEHRKLTLSDKHPVGSTLQPKCLLCPT
jgi:hypothetical protein